MTRTELTTQVRDLIEEKTNTTGLGGETLGSGQVAAQVVYLIDQFCEELVQGLHNLFKDDSDE